MAVNSSVKADLDSGVCEKRKLNGMNSKTRTPTVGSRAARSWRKDVYGYSPMPIPWRKMTGCLVGCVCGRCQYEMCLAGEREDKIVCGRGGRTRNQAPGAKWLKECREKRMQVVKSTT